MPFLAQIELAIESVTCGSRFERSLMRPTLSSLSFLTSMFSIFSGFAMASFVDSEAPL